MSDFNNQGGQNNQQGNQGQQAPNGDQGNQGQGGVPSNPYGYPQGGQQQFYSNQQPNQNPYQQQYNTQPQINQFGQFGQPQNQPPAAHQEPAKAVETKQEGNQDTSQFKPEDFSGDSALDVSINILTKTTGITEDLFAESISNAIQYGNADLIDVAKLTAGLKPDQAAQAIAIARAAYTHAANVKTQTENLIKQVAGSEAAWRETVGVFNTKADEAAKYYAKHLEESGKVAEAIQYITNYSKERGLVTSQQGNLIQGNGGQSGGVGLSSEEFKAKWGELDRKYGNNLYSNKQAKLETAELLRLRQIGKQQGR